MDKAILEAARAYMDALTVDSAVNVPEAVVAREDKFFTWDNEKRTPAREPYLFDWSYYNGVVMEGLFDVAEAQPDRGGRYLNYVTRYLDGLIVRDGAGRPCLSRNLAGYVDCHGADCYKTAALLLRAAEKLGREDYMAVCRDLYRDLTDETYVNSTGHTVPKEYTEASLGHNYWHTWRNDKPPKYKVWLDGLYMLQPFIARFAARTGDERQLQLVQERFDWAAEALRAPSGLYYHAGSGRGDVCPYHWTRSMGWYGMAMADVMEVLPEELIPARIKTLNAFVEGVLRYQKDSGLWTNLTDMPETATNRSETSGTAMMVYTVLKGARLGWLDPSLREPAARAFEVLVREKLRDGHLTDIYLKAAANGSDNYNLPDYYLPDEGKGAGPFIMAYAEMMRL